MSIGHEYNNTLRGLIKDLEALAKEHGDDACISLPKPNYYYPDFDGQNSKLTAVLSRQPGPKRIIIIEQNIR